MTKKKDKEYSKVILGDKPDPYHFSFQRLQSKINVYFSYGWDRTFCSIEIEYPKSNDVYIYIGYTRRNPKDVYDPIIGRHKSFERAVQCLIEKHIKRAFAELPEFQRSFQGGVNYTRMLISTEKKAFAAAYWAHFKEIENDKSTEKSKE